MEGHAPSWPQKKASAGSRGSGFYAWPIAAGTPARTIPAIRTPARRSRMPRPGPASQWGPVTLPVAAKPGFTWNAATNQCVAGAEGSCGEMLACLGRLYRERLNLPAALPGSGHGVQLRRSGSGDGAGRVCHPVPGRLPDRSILPGVLALSSELSGCVLPVGGVPSPQRAPYRGLRFSKKGPEPLLKRRRSGRTGPGSCPRA
jgi:hypothetical protein